MGGEVALRGVDKAFGVQPVLRGFSLALPAGGAVALMGPSGGGKTTAARILLGLEKPDAGMVEVQKGTRFSCLFEDDRLCEGFSALYNARLVLPRPCWPQVQAAFSQLLMEEEDLVKPVRSLSGGQRRRVALVRAMEAESDVIVLDEAFKALDVETKARAVDYINSRRDGRSLLLITHDTADAQALGASIVRLEKLAGVADG